MAVTLSDDRLRAMLFSNYVWPRNGKGLTLTYSIQRTGPDGLNARHTAMITEALRQWSRVANVRFQQVDQWGQLQFRGMDGGAMRRHTFGEVTG